MELKEDILKLFKEDFNFRNEVKYLLDINEIEDEIDRIEDKIRS